jgi:hypothetical protein
MRKENVKHNNAKDLVTNSDTDDGKRRESGTETKYSEPRGGVEEVPTSKSKDKEPKD